MIYGSEISGFQAQGTQRSSSDPELNQRWAQNFFFFHFILLNSGDTIPSFNYFHSALWVFFPSKETKTTATTTKTNVLWTPLYPEGLRSHHAFTLIITSLLENQESHTCIPPAGWGCRILKEKKSRQEEIMPLLGGFSGLCDISSLVPPICNFNNLWERWTIDNESNENIWRGL